MCADLVDWLAQTERVDIDGCGMEVCSWLARYMYLARGKLLIRHATDVMAARDSANHADGIANPASTQSKQRMQPFHPAESRRSMEDEPSGP